MISNLSSIPRDAYIHSAPWDSGMLPVGTIHKLHYEQYGKKDGKPVIFLHGGPGGGTSLQSTIHFDPSIYRVVLLDQRGAGKSIPPADMRENTSHHLVADIEALRDHLHILKWHMVFGGSWGSTLALLYAQTHPEAVGSLVLRGIFTVRKSELDWLYVSMGPRDIFPESYKPYIEYLPVEDRHDPISAYYKRMTSDNPETCLTAARIWARLELSMVALTSEEGLLEKLEDDTWTLQFSKTEAYYFMHGAWLEDGQLLRKANIDKIRHIPATIVQGRYDLICPATTAFDLQKAWPEATFVLVPDAGHSVKDLGIHNSLMDACDQYARL